MEKWGLHRKAYTPVTELAAEIVRHQNEEPIIARPPSKTYRIGKFIKRHKFGVATTALVIILVVIGGIVTSIGFVQASRAKELAKKEAETAKQTSAFLVDLFEVSDPSEAKGNTITAREILDKGAEKINKELDEQPLVKARLMDTIGNVYHKLGLYKEARSFLEEGLAIREEVLGPETEEVADSLE
jgi:hypothetical protein